MQQQLGWRMIELIRIDRSNHARFIDHLREMRKEFTDPHALLIVVLPRKFVLARGQRQSTRLIGRHARDALSIPNVVGQLLAGHVFELRFVIPKIKLAGSAAHEQVDDVLGFGRVMESLLISCFLSEKLRSQKLCHGSRAKAQRGSPQQLASGHLELRVVGVTRLRGGVCAHFANIRVVGVGEERNGPRV